MLFGAHRESSRGRRSWPNEPPARRRRAAAVLVVRQLGPVQRRAPASGAAVEIGAVAWGVLDDLGDRYGLGLTIARPAGGVSPRGPDCRAGRRRRRRREHGSGEDAGEEENRSPSERSRLRLVELQPGMIRGKAAWHRSFQPAPTAVRRRPRRRSETLSDRGARAAETPRGSHATRRCRRGPEQDGRVSVKPGVGLEPGGRGGRRRHADCVRSPSARSPEGISCRFVVSSMVRVPPLAGADDPDDFLVLLAEAQLGGLEEPVDDVRVVLHAVVHELRVAGARERRRERVLRDRASLRGNG